MGRPIPEIRDRLHELADELGCEELHELAEATKREPASHMARIKRRKMTPRLGQRVRAYVKANPGMNLDEVGLVFNIAGGRVSEAINGKHLDPVLEAYDAGEA